MGWFKSFLDTLYYMLFSGDWFSAVLAVIIILVILAVVGAVLWGLFYLVDTCFLPTMQRAGVINGKGHSPSSMILIGTGGILNPYFIPEEWSVSVSVGKRSGWMSVSKSYHDFVKIGEPVVVRYSNRRITRRLHIKSLSYT